MKKYNLLAVILLAILLSNCESTKESFFSLNKAILKAQYFQKDKLSLEILNPKMQKIDSVVYTLNDKKIGIVKNASPFSFALATQKLGVQNLKATVYSEGNTELDSTTIEVVSDIEPKLLSYTIVNTYPHDVTAYTQGLEFYRDTLYEGTGNGAGNGTGVRGISSLRKTDFRTGKVLKKIELPMEYFGEGITILNNKVYQLTYQNNEGYVYNADTFKKEKTLPYFQKMEGWGLTTDGKKLYMNDGSEKIHILNPDTFEQLDYFNVYSGGTKIPSVNEMEWVDGKIYSNIYGKEAVIIINPINGAVESIINFADLKKKITQLPDTDVLNGIAYIQKQKLFS